MPRTPLNPIAELSRFSKEFEKISLFNKPTNFLIEKSPQELMDYIVIQHDLLKEAYRAVVNLTTSGQLKNLPQANTILDHWKTFHNALDENPSLKEEWDSLLVAMRLTFDK